MAEALFGPLQLPQVLALCFLHERDHSPFGLDSEK